ncbi:LysE family transporter [Azospirillum sp. YIM B02556]|uniref:LysE family transporter n=1 Tax=Azospirillum endophyticum TaxID=2800326 RepID=A0ABS1F0U1_9PROT|nr:LysE family transporter [Azospirillum endophyticum]MBK1837033.1 LysE family transporter [Azospirillum endophyticum]
MDPVLAFVSIAGAIAVGAASPGPSFVLVARTSIAVSRRAGLATAIGMGTGGVCFASLALLGLHALLSQVGWLYAGLKLVGGAYLLYLAVRIWRGAAEALVVADEGRTAPAGLMRPLLFGLLTQLSNPKTALVYGSIFAALMPVEPPLWLFVFLPPAIFLIEAGWYAIVAVAFSAGRPRAAYLRSKRRVDRVAAAAIGGLGVRLMSDALPPP